MNNTSGKSMPPPPVLAYVYSGIGVGGVISNMFIFLILISDKNLFKQSAIIAGLAVSHVLCAVTTGANGLYRIFVAPPLDLETSPWSCVDRIYPILYPIGLQSTGTVLVLVGVERFTVFSFPNWYRIKWTAKMCWKMVGVGYACVFVSFCVGLYTISYQRPVSVYCVYVTLFPKTYVIYSNTVSALGGVVAVSFTLRALMTGMKQAKLVPILTGEAGRYKRQLRLTRAMLSVSLFDVGLVVIPSLLFIAWLSNPSLFPKTNSWNFANLTTITYSLNTLTNLVAQLTFNSNFRIAAGKLFRCKKYGGQSHSTVTPIGPVEMKGRVVNDANAAGEGEEES